MGLLNLTAPVLGQQNSVADAATANAFSALQTWANGNVDETNMPAATLQRLGLNGSGTVGRGKTIIPTTESRTNVAFGLMTTPDRVSGLVLPTDGLIVVNYQATWQASVASAGFADIFIGPNRLKVATTGQASPSSGGGQSPTTANTDSALASFELGLMSTNSGSYTGDVTTGQAVGITGTVNVGASRGGPCYIFASAGTYDVSVQFLATSGSVTVKNRKLWVWTLGF